jgi:hypothetical protein
MRTFTGNIPQGKERIARNQGWSVYLLRMETSKREFKYAHLKVVSNSPRFGKANFWIQWSIGRVRIIKGKEALSLFRWYPDVTTWVEDAMKRHFGNNVIPFTSLHLIRNRE